MMTGTRLRKTRALMMGRWDFRRPVEKMTLVNQMDMVEWIQTSIAYGQEEAYGKGYYNKNGK
jgi:hypothetical protein